MIGIDAVGAPVLLEVIGIDDVGAPLLLGMIGIDDVGAPLLLGMIGIDDVRARTEPCSIEIDDRGLGRSPAVSRSTIEGSGGALQHRDRRSRARAEPCSIEIDDPGHRRNSCVVTFEPSALHGMHCRHSGGDAGHGQGLCPRAG
jgi:hypothetical protein